MDKKYNKLKLTEKDINIIENDTDGKCYYRILSQFFNNNEGFHIFYLFYRKEIAKYIDAKKQQ